MKITANALEAMLCGAEVSRAAIEKLCATAREQCLRGVCINGSCVELACALLEETEVKVTALVGFPLGAMDRDVKRYETETAVDHGAHEIEMVLNLGRLKDGDLKYVLRELRDVAEAADERPVKVVLETSRLSREEIVLACQLTLDSGAQLVSTGSGLLATATVSDVALLRESVGDQFGVKAVGRFGDARVAGALLTAGASRLGTFDDDDLVRILHSESN